MKAVSIVIPPDKSISHRAVMLASVSEGTTHIKNILMAEDIKRTIEAFQAMGVSIFFERGPKGRVEKFSTRFARSNGIGSADIVIHGVGMRGLKKPARPLYLGNSGTTMRILPGILAGQDFEVTLTGDKSLSARPMQRIAEPLKKMGAHVVAASYAANVNVRLAAQGAAATADNVEIMPPLKIHGGKLKAIKYISKIASGQVKSCILFAGLYAEGVTSVTEPEKSRDHTERMLRQFGIKVFSTPFGRSKNIVRARPKAESRTIKLKGPVRLKSPGVITVPGDISSAAFFIVAGCILPDIKIIIKNVGLNPTRAGILDILKKMGADIYFSTPFGRSKNIVRAKVENYEPVGDIVVKSSALKGVAVSPKEVVRAIDEMPVIMTAACFAKGRTIIRGIGELRVKETDRIKSMVTNLSKIGADIKVIGRANTERIVINGGKPLHGAKVSSFGDHRTAMSMLVAGLGTKGRVVVTGLDCINKSFPNFQDLLNKLN